MNNIIIKENFLSESIFLEIQNALLSPYFPWYFNNRVVENNDGFFQFTHTFYNNNEIVSDRFDSILPLINKINPDSLIRVKANLLTMTNKKVIHGFHIDNESIESLSCVYYINTNNGSTVFYNSEVFSKKNTAVFFPSNLFHSGSTCTDEQRRVIINIVYKKINGDEICQI